MLVPLRAEPGQLPEWALVEMQGRIEPQRDVSLQESLVVGALQLAQANRDVVQLQIGYHVLEGKRLALKKPLAILENQQQSAADGESSSSTVAKVVGVLRHKYLFKTRPRALISKPCGSRNAGG